MTDYHRETKTIVGNNHPASAHEAAERVNAESWRERVHNFIFSKGLAGATRDEACAHYHAAKPNTIKPRFTDLLALGLIFTSPERRGAENICIDACFYDSWRTANPHLAPIPYKPRGGTPVPPSGMYPCPCCNNMLEWCAKSGRFIAGGQRDLF